MTPLPHGVGRAVRGRGAIGKWTWTGSECIYTAHSAESTCKCDKDNIIDMLREETQQNMK